MDSAHVKDHLHDHLRWVRASLVGKLHGLSEPDVRRPMTASGTNMLGLVKHCASWDSRYFGVVFDRPFPAALPAWDDPGASGLDMRATDDETSESIVDLYRRVCEHADETIGAFELDALGFVPWWDESVPLYNVMLHCLSETTRHAGHADILREGIDGVIGIDPPG